MSENDWNLITSILNEAVQRWSKNLPGDYLDQLMQLIQQVRTRGSWGAALQFYGLEDTENWEDLLSIIIDVNDSDVIDTEMEVDSTDYCE